MLVANRMTKEPVTAESVDLLIRASHKMQTGGFRRLPVVADGKLVGIITDVTCASIAATWSTRRSTA